MDVEAQHALRAFPYDKFIDYCQHYASKSFIDSDMCPVGSIVSLPVMVVDIEDGWNKNGAKRRERERERERKRKEQEETEREIERERERKIKRERERDKEKEKKKERKEYKWFLPPRGALCFSSSSL